MPRRTSDAPRAVLFDLDGTLLDSRQSIRETLNTVLHERGLPGFSATDMAGLIGRPLRDILSDRTKDPAAVEAMTQRYRAAYNESGWVTVSLFPGLVALIDRLRRDGVRIATVTSKGQHETETLLADLGVADRFDAVVGDDDVRPLKPHPAPVLEACRMLGVGPADAIMVGDTTFDVLSGKGAGARTVGVLWGIHAAGTLREAGASALAADAKELALAIRRLQREG